MNTMLLSSEEQVWVAIINKASEIGDLDTVKDTITKFTVGEYARQSCLAHAVQYGHMPIILYILERGVNVDYTLQCVFAYVCKIAHWNAIHTMLKLNLDVLRIISCGAYSACENGHVDVYKYLCAHYGRITLYTRDINYLCAAVNSGSMEMFEYVLSQMNTSSFDWTMFLTKYIFPGKPTLYKNKAVEHILQYMEIRWDDKSLWKKSKFLVHILNSMLKKSGHSKKHVSANAFIRLTGVINDAFSMEWLKAHATEFPDDTTFIITKMIEIYDVTKIFIQESTLLPGVLVNEIAQYLPL